VVAFEFHNLKVGGSSPPPRTICEEVRVDNVEWSAKLLFVGYNSNAYKRHANLLKMAEWSQEYFYLILHNNERRLSL
jgi:hypothetical protein